MEPKNADEATLKKRFAKVLGSAVNPVLREGNSDRRVAAPVKEYASKNPHRMMDWKPTTMTRVASMTEGDFYESEKSMIMPKEDSLKIQFVSQDGKTTVLKESVKLQKEEVVDAAVMKAAALRKYFQKQIDA